MPWSAAILRTSKDAELVSVDIQYSDGSVSFVKNYKGTGRFDIESIVRNQIKNLELTAAAEMPAPGPIIPPVDTPPTAEYLQFQRDLAKLQIVKLLVDMGGVTIDNVKVVALVNRIKAALPNVWDQI